MSNNTKYKQIKYNGEWKIDKNQGWNSGQTIFNGSFINKNKNNDTGDEEEITFSGQWKKNEHYKDNNTTFEGTFEGDITDNNTSKLNNIITYYYDNMTNNDIIDTKHNYNYTGEWFGKWDNKNFNGKFNGISKNAFVLVHFGNNIKFLKYEILFLINLRKNTKNNIVYMYSIYDTPKSFVKIIEKYCDKIIPYDDTNITVGKEELTKDFSPFELRTCNYLFAHNLLTEYEKICTVESDMIIMSNIDEMFNLETPSILIYTNHKVKCIFKKYKLEKKIENYEKYDINGGSMLFKPEKEKYNICLDKLQEILQNPYYKCVKKDKKGMDKIINCKNIPNEKLFLLTNDIIYNLPYIYNATRRQLLQTQILGQYLLNDVVFQKQIKIIHFNSKSKPLDFIEDSGGKYLKEEEFKNIIVYNILTEYKENYYNKYNQKIENILKNILVN